MPKAKLDQNFCLTATCVPGKRKTDYWDSGQSCTGLVLECRQSGGKTLYLKYLDPDQRRRQLKIGGFSPP